MSCTAEVLYHLGSTSTAPDVQVTVQGELRSTEEADQEFYNHIRSLEKELVAENIPGTAKAGGGPGPHPALSTLLFLRESSELLPFLFRGLCSHSHCIYSWF